MTDENTGQTTTSEPQGNEETPSVEELLAQIEEWKGHARKHEDRAKTNAEAAKRLSEIEREQMTDAEKAEAARAEIEQRATDAEERATQAEAALARLQIVHEFGLDEDDTAALEGVTDPETLRTLAARLAGRSTSGPKPQPSQGKARKPAPTTPAQAFADALEGLL